MCIRDRSKVQGGRGGAHLLARVQGVVQGVADGRAVRLTRRPLVRHQVRRIGRLLPVRHRGKRLLRGPIKRERVREREVGGGGGRSVIQPDVRRARRDISGGQGDRSSGQAATTTRG
eukprot:447324-Prorocentrum_minimum.AAC.6